MKKQYVAYKTFNIFNYIFLALSALLCVFPFIHILAQSFSSAVSVAANEVMFWPVEFTLSSYRKVVAEGAFLKSMAITLKRVVIGVTLNMVLTVLMAYPLSKNSNVFRGRTCYAWMLVFTMLFSGGLVPLYILVNSLGLMDSIWALVLPGAVPVYNVVLMLNFFRSLPRALEESAFIDGATHWMTLFKIYIPISKPAIATLVLFSLVSHWNSWFDGLIFMNNPDKYPLSSYLQTIIIPINVSNINDLDDLKMISDQTIKAAQIFIGALPIFLVYPFLQKYFTTGIVLGAVKE